MKHNIQDKQVDNSSQPGPKPKTTTVVMLEYDWWLRMVINISVQYSGGLLPDIILLTQGYYQWGTR